MSMEIKIFDQISSIAATEWDSIVGSQDIFHSHRFLNALEESAVENASYQYLLFYREGQLKASAVLSTFVIQLDLLVPKHAVTTAIKKLLPNFFKMIICFCGTPVSIGQRNLVAVSNGDLPEIIPLLTSQMRVFAKKNGARSLILKEFFEPDTALLEPLLAKQGFFKGYSLPYLKLPIRWKSFDAYLAEMRSTFRRQLMTSLKKITVSVPAKNPVVIPFCSPAFNGPEQAVSIQVLDEKTCPPALFYELYMSVMGRAAVKLETLNQSFFYHFFEKMPENKRVLGLVRGETVLGVVLLVEHGPELTFVWAGKPEARDDAFDNYFNLLAGMVDYAIQHGFQVLNFGQVAFYTKQRLGGLPHQLHIFFKSESWFWHRVVRLFGADIFPKVELPVYEVFKNENDSDTPGGNSI